MSKLRVCGNPYCRLTHYSDEHLNDDGDLVCEACGTVTKGPDGHPPDERTDTG